VNASTSCPAAIKAAARDDQCLGAESVEQQTSGHLCAGVHDDLKDHERGQHAGLAPKRSAASRPETPRVVRSRTATMYASSPVARRSRDAHRTFQHEKFCPDVLQTYCDSIIAHRVGPMPIPRR